MHIEYRLGTEIQVTNQGKQKKILYERKYMHTWLLCTDRDNNVKENMWHIFKYIDKCGYECMCAERTREKSQPLAHVEGSIVHK